MPTLTVENGKIYYESHGEGLPVVLAHGVGGNHAIWYQQIPALSERYRVIAFDHRGFGNSIDEQGHGRSKFVSDLRSLLDHLEIERTALVGQSMGGGTCLGFTCAHPDRVAAMVMTDSLHGFVEPEAVQEIMDRARQDTDGLTQLERVLGSGTRLGDPVRSVLYRQINSFNATNRKNLKGRFEPLYTPEQLAATGVPFLFLVGEEDVLFPAAAVREMHKQVNNSGYVEVKNAGHSVFFEDPDAFNSAVIEFLEQNYSG